MALAAALLGWLFDGLEMGLFPLTAREALLDLGVASEQVSHWFGIITALFLVGAATGGVLFGWLGDKIGRVRAMMLSVLTYALISGLCGFATSAWQIGVLRFIAALGMGGEWSLGVALINEIWPARSRAFLAGLIGAAANIGYLTIALAGKWLFANITEVRELLTTLGLDSELVDYLVTSENKGWRLLMMVGALPALLTFFIRLYVPESHRWEKERQGGGTANWANRDLLGIVVGAAGACGIIVLWASDWPLLLQIGGTLVCLIIVSVGYLYPVVHYLQRAENGDHRTNGDLHAIIHWMLMAACLSGVALLGTWATIQQVPSWIGQKAPEVPTAGSQAQIWSALGAIVGTILAAFAADWLGRRITYTLLCLGSLIIIPTLFLTTKEFDTRFLVFVFLAGGITASFYGWLPLYLPELFPTRVRATGQGFGFNFGRILAAIGVLQLGHLKELVSPHGWGTSQVCALLSGIYLLGMILIWFAPETKGKPLPE